MSKVFHSWEVATDEHKVTYILGDFNKNWLDENDSAILRYYSEICCLKQTISLLERFVHLVANINMYGFDIFEQSR